jgi:hypothetical protein
MIVLHRRMPRVISALSAGHSSVVHTATDRKHSETNLDVRTPPPPLRGGTF